MVNQDLFKQAIAEAKSVREAAIANAKEALEETITPHLKDLLAAKLQEMEAQDEAAEVVNEEEEIEEAKHEDDMDEGKKDDEETMEEEVVSEEDAVEEEVVSEEEVDEAQGNVDAHEENPHDQLEEEEVTEEEEAVAEADDDEKAEDESEESDDEANGEEEAEEEVEVKDMEVEDLKDMIRDIISQEMGHGEEEDLGMDMDMDAEEQPADMVSAEDEEIDLDELLKELEGLAEGEKEDEMDEAAEDSVDEAKEEEVDESVNPLQAELDAATATIQELTNNLSEVNLLNAKLLYLNKIFRNNNLTESQKVNVIAAFDKAESAKEVKLVFETLKESIVAKKQETIKESKGFASKAAGNSTKGEIINEVSDQVRRMQKLAGIIR